MLGNLRGWHILVLLVVVLLLFGAPKLPELARNLGKSLNILKEETQNLRDPKPEDEDKAVGGADGTSKEARDD
jgi:twin arginine-targeting protein translocase, TatA/E family